EDHPSTKEGKAREGNVKTITPNYKLGTEKPSHELKLGTSGYLPNEKGDYKVGYCYIKRKHYSGLELLMLNSFTEETLSILIVMKQYGTN
ncbi:unnamed protein product, partial [Haemonchus placei]|uniref:Nucleocapsid protein n=1 Tax=Haemonchus placei TaxID=6290 RepID=A0A0N4WXI9_HAEPC